MPKSWIADRKPTKVHLEPGQHYWCACGRSKNQPFCDGSHVGTGIKPVGFTIEEAGDHYLCMCKQTGDAPFCDGTHKTLPEGVTELETPADRVDPAAATQTSVAKTVKPSDIKVPTSIVADHKPTKVHLEPGKYHWCACGRSKNQPFCDGSHAGTGVKPVEFTIEEAGDHYLCMCKQTGDSPFCDGTHKTIDKATTELPTPTDRWADQEQAKQYQAAQQAQGSDAQKVDAEDASSKAPKPVSTPEEPTVEFIHDLAKHGLKFSGPHGPTDAMGVPRAQLPDWNDIQLLTAQLHTQPLDDNAPVSTQLVVGPNAQKPLTLDMPLFVSDMSYGALSEEAKIALAQGAEKAGTGIASGEGGVLPEAKQANSRYFYEMASGQFGYSEELLTQIQAFHFKGGQAAKTGTGGHLPGAKVSEKIAQVRGVEAGKTVVSPSHFPNLKTTADFKDFADHVREVSGGIPIGFKMSAQHIEQDIDFALEATADYIILDGRGGGTGAAPLLFRNNIAVPTIPALARARAHLKRNQREDVTLIITGGLRTPADFIKALCLGADGIALANSAMQAIGCVGARICHTNNCPTGIATQKPELRKRLNVQKSTMQLARFLTSSTQMMQVMARACGHDSLAGFNQNDLTTWKKDMADLTGIAFGGIG